MEEVNDIKEVNLSDLLQTNSSNSSNNNSTEGGDVKFTDKQKDELNKMIFKRKWEYKKQQLAAQRGGKMRYEERKLRAEAKQMSINGQDGQAGHIHTAECNHSNDSKIVDTKVENKKQDNIESEKKVILDAPSKAKLARIKRRQKQKEKKKLEAKQNDNGAKTYEVKDESTGQTIKYHLDNEDAELN